MGAHLTPKRKREMLSRLAEVRRDEKKREAYAIVADEYGISARTVARTSLTETSSDYEITPSPIREVVRPSSNCILDDHGRYPLGDKPLKVLVLPDTQIPYHDQRSLDIVLRYASENYYDLCIQLGDFMDWDFCSRWTADNAKKAEGQRFLSEYIHGNAVLDDIQQAVRNKNPKCDLIVIEGNHDWRIENVINKTPALSGMIDMEKNLRFEERKALFWRYWIHKKPVIVGKALFIHGDFIGTHHAKKTADSYHRNVFYGHTHTLQAYTKTTLAEDSVQCWSLGTLSKFDLEYMGKRPSSWMQCFAEFFIQPSGNFNHYVTNIIDHEFTAINGGHYKG